MPPRHKHPHEGYRLPIWKAFQRIRYTLGWTSHRMAQEIGVSHSGYRTCEQERYEVSVRMIERVRENTGFDPYVMAYILWCDYSKWPPRVQGILKELRDEWEKELETMRMIRQRLPGKW